MATKKEKLIASIREKNPNIYTDDYMSIKELTAILDKLNTNLEPEVEQAPEPKEPDALTTEPEPETETATETTKKSEFDELQEKIAGATPPEPQQARQRPPVEKTTRRKKKGESSPDSTRIEGYILVLVTDTVFPFGFAAINNMLDKRIKINASDLVLSEKQAKELEYLADQAADYMQVNINPIAGFFIAASFMYGNNLMTIRMNFNKSDK